MAEMEIIKPNEKLIQLTEEVLTQNKMILTMNARLLDVIAHPCVVVKGDATRKQKK